MRRTLAFSIHELAVILGDQLTAADLVPIFNGFLKDLDEVRIGVLKHLYDFLKVSSQKNAIKESNSLGMKTKLCVFCRVLAAAAACRQKERVFVPTTGIHGN